MSKKQRKQKPHQQASTPNTRGEAARIIARVLRDQAYANRLLDASLTAHIWDPRDSGLLTELVYGVLRRLLTINAILDGVAKKGVDSIDPAVRVHLQVAVYQMMALDRIPTRAIISEAVALVRKQRGKSVGGFVNAMLRTLQREPERLTISPEGRSRAQYLSLSTSHPEWLVERYIQRWGEEGAEARLHANNLPAPTTLRINPTWGTRQDWLHLLDKEEIEATPTPFAPEGITLAQQQGALQKLQQRHPTATAVQDEAAQLLAHWLAPQPGEELLDACAAPGGKTTHIASLAPDANVTAFDVHEHKITLLRQAGRRFGLTNIKPRLVDATGPLPDEAAGPFDRILCDAPCSGLGILRRQPEIRYRRTADDLQRLQALQSQLLDNLAAALKPGGIFIYSVCTDTEEETTQVVEQFLQKHPEFTRCPDAREDAPWTPLLDQHGDLRTAPDVHHMDGFFASRWQKRPTNTPS